MTAPIETFTKEQLLNRFQAKAGCVHTQDQAARCWSYLQRYLTDDERTKLFQGWNHHEMCREGRGELDGACNELRLKWARIS